MSEEESCAEKELYAENLSSIPNPTINELIDSAEAFFDLATCYDRKGDRKRAAKTYSLAGEFFMSIEERDRAAECYGKAILRNLMANDLDSAKILLDKGKEYGEQFDTFHFRLANDTFSRRITDELDQLYNEEYYGFKESLITDTQDIDLYDELPSSPLLNDLELEEILIEQPVTDFSFQKDKETLSKIFSKKDYELNAEIDSEKRNKVIDTLISSAKKNLPHDIVSKITAKSDSGKSISLKQTRAIFLSEMNNIQDINGISEARVVDNNLDEKLELIDISLNFDSLEDINNSLRVTSKSEEPLSSVTSPLEVPDIKKDLLITENGYSDQLSNDVLLKEVETLPQSSYDDLLTQMSEFISISEINNEEKNDLENIEIKDVIPLNWQVKGVKTTKDVQLIKQEIDQETGSLIFTWKSKKLRSGQKTRVQYILTKKIQRTIIMVIQNHISLQSVYFNIEKSGKIGLISEIPLELPESKKIDFLLIEDIIPPELKVTGILPSNLPFLQYHTREGLLFRWIFTNYVKQTDLSFEYRLIERPLTIAVNHVYKFKDHPEASLRIIKLVEHLIDLLSYEYIIYYEINSEELPNCSIDLLDSIYPKNIQIELLASNPTWMRPSIRFSEGNIKRYEWNNIELEGNKTRKFVIRIRTDSPLKSVDPSVLIKKSGLNAATIKCEINEDVISNEILDLRKNMGLSLIK